MYQLDRVRLGKWVSKANAGKEGVGSLGILVKKAMALQKLPRAAQAYLNSVRKHHSICRDSWGNCREGCQARLGQWPCWEGGKAIGADETHVSVTLRDGKVLPWKQEQQRPPGGGADGRSESYRRGDRVAWDILGTPGGCWLVSPGAGTQKQELLDPLLPLPKACV